jgi:hypothetical protein
MGKYKYAGEKRFWTPPGELETPFPKSLTLKMATSRFVETLENVQRTRCISKSRKHIKPQPHELKH